METPCNKGFRFNMFTSSNRNDSFFRFINTSSAFKENRNLNSNHSKDFSFSKYLITDKKYKPDFDYEVKNSQSKELKFNNCSVDNENENENLKEIHKLNVSKSKFRINNINFNINLSYFKESGNSIRSTNASNTSNTARGSHFNQFSNLKTNVKNKPDTNSVILNTTAIRKNLLSKLDENSAVKQSTTSSESFVRQILDEKKTKLNLTKLIIDDYRLIEKEKQIEGNLLSEEYYDRDLEDQLNYILDPDNNIKKEHEKRKKTNSCKCTKTACSKFSCNCLRNGIKCDFLCRCKNCENINKFDENTQSNSDLLKKKTERE